MHKKRSMIQSGIPYDDGVIEYEITLDHTDPTSILNISNSIKQFNKTARVPVLVFINSLPYLDSPYKQCFMCGSNLTPLVKRAELIIKLNHRMNTIATKINRCQNTTCGFTFFNNKQFTELLESIRDNLT